MRITSTLSSIGIQLIATVLGLIGSVLQARWLGPSNRGLLSLLMLYPSLILFVLNFGIFAATTYYASKENCNLNKLFSSLIFLCTLQSLVAFAIGIPLINWLLQKYHSDAVRLSQHFLITIPFSLLSIYIQSLLRGRKHFAYNNVIKLTIPIFYCSSTIILFTNDIMSVKSLLYSQIIAQVVSLVIAIAILFRCESLSFDKYFLTEVRELLGYGSKLWLSEMTEVVNGRLDQIAIGNYLNTTTLGIYNVSVSYASLSNILASGVRQVMLPYVSSSTNWHEKQTEIYTFFGKYWPLSIIQLIFMIIGANFLIPYVFGSLYHDAIFFAQLLSIAFVFLNAKNVLSTALQGLNRPGESAIIDIVGFILTVSAMLYLNVHTTLHNITAMFIGIYFLQFVVNLYYLKKNDLSIINLLVRIDLHNIHKFRN